MYYELRQYDSALLTFHIERTPVGEISYFIDWIDEQRKYLLPIGMEITGEGLGRWLSSRVIPKNREFVDQILSRSGLSHNDTMGIINLCKGLSLNDSYWVVEQGFQGKFENYNLYQNSFARALALIAYTGYGSATKRGFSSSPEYTTNGMLRKCWRRINKKIYLYKGGTTGAANTGNEPYSEYYASQIADTMGLYHVSYGLVKWKGMVCSTCELFTDIDTSYVPIYKFVDKSTLTNIAAFLKNLGEDFYNGFVDMLVFDALTYNTDRHFGNFGLLVDNKTNQPIAFAPIFDNGLSLFNYAMDDDLRDLENYAKTRLPAFEGATYEAIVNEFITDRQKEQLRKMINFTFRKHPKYNLPANRLKRIEDHIQKRIQELLSLGK